MRTGLLHVTLMAGSLLAGGFLDSSCFAARQVGAVTVDGSITEIDGSAEAIQTVASGFGPGNVDLFRMRISNDATNLYMGIASKFSDASGTRGIWVCGNLSILSSRPIANHTRNARWGAMSLSLVRGILPWIARRKRSG